MLDKNNLIIIYGKTNCFKSSLASTLVNGLDELACYINLEDNRHLKFNTKVKEIDNSNVITREYINDLISDYNVVLIDSMESLNYSVDDLIYLKELAKLNTTTVIVISNSDNVEKYSNVADLMIHSKRN